MTKEIVQKDWTLDDEKLAALAKSGIIPANTPKSQVQVFAEVARRHGLDPFTKEIHLVKYGATYSTIIGIQGMRGRAADSGLHAGTDAPKFNLQPDGRHDTMAQLLASKKMPITCTVTVYKIVGNTRTPFVATVAFKEFAQRGGKWPQMPYNMIAKVAESHALRKAFPRHINGLYLDEEMQQEINTVDTEYTEVRSPEEKDLRAKLRSALSEMSPEEAEGWRNMLNEKREAGELDETFMQNVLDEITQSANA